MLLAGRAPLPRGVARRAIGAIALLALAWLASSAGAQEPPREAGAGGTAGAEAEAPIVPIEPVDVVSRAAETQRSLRALESRAGQLPEIDSIAQRLAEVGALWSGEADDALELLQRETSPTVVNEVERVWSLREELLERWSATLRKQAGPLAEDLTRLDRQRELWERTRDADRKEELPGALRETIREVLRAVEATRQTLRERRNAVLTVESSVLEEQRLVADVLDAVGAARERGRSGLVTLDSPPLWDALAHARPTESGQRIVSAWRDSIADLGTYVREQADALVAFALFFAATVLVIALLGRRAARWAAEDEGSAAAARMLARPVSAALLIVMVSYPLVLTSVPPLLRWLAGVVLLLPALRLIGPLLAGNARRAVYLLSVWFALDSVRLLLASAPLLLRVLLLLEAAGAIAATVWLLRSRQPAPGRPESRRLRILRGATRFALLLMVVSLFSNLVGNLSLAEVLVYGTLRGAYAAVLLHGSALVLQDLWAVLLHTRTLRLLRGVSRHEALLRRRGATLVELGLAAVWLWFTLGGFQLREPVWRGVRAVLGANWPIGDVELSLGDVAAFALTVWFAIWLSRFVRFVLDEDVLPRAHLPRGVPYAISSGTHYVILLLGFLLAVAAAGFDMSRFALIVGALGVGIGIGLQDVVNNFVSGLILLFERPVQLGDTVQVGDVLGEVRRIGMRSSTVRTWSGAEVIVPNSKLVSENLVNWTLSDNLRRVEIPIGVAYGTDPERVLALLLEVARAHPAVLAEPRPSALFQAHGSSSLDFELRAWTASGDWFVVRSELTVAINRALREAGIEIPFPQHDLHLRSVDAEVRGALRGGSRE